MASLQEWLFVSATLMATGSLATAAKITIGVQREYSQSVLRSLEHLGIQDKYRIANLPDQYNQTDLEYVQKVVSALRRSEAKVVIGRYSSLVAMATQSFGIPYFITTLMPLDEANTTTSRGMFGLLPGYSDLDQVVLDLLEKYRRTDIAVFVDSHSGLAMLKNVIERPTLFCKACRVDSTDKTVIRPYLLSARDSKIQHYVIATDPNTARAIIKQASRLAMVSEPFTWIIINLGFVDIGYSVFDHIMANITTIALQPRQARTVPEYGSNLELELIRDALNTVNQNILSSTQDNKDTFRNIRQNSVDGESGLLSFDAQGHRANLTLSLIGHGDGPKRHVGVWQATPPLFANRLQLHYSNDTELNGNAIGNRKARVVTIKAPPFTFVDNNKTGNDRFHGFAIDILNDVARMLNFDFEIYEVPDGFFGDKNATTGEWNGIIGELLNGNATMCIAPISINADREGVVDFTKPFKSRGITAIIKTPETSSSYLQFLSPLDGSVWLCVLLAFVVVSIILFLLEKNSQPCSPDVPRLNLYESTWFVFAALVGGSSETGTATVPGRILTSGWWFFGLILVSSYTANLAAFLTVKKINTPIQDVTDLASQTQIKYGSVAQSGVMQFFSRTKVDQFQKMWAHMSEMDVGSIVDTLEDGVERVKQGDYAFLWDDATNSYITKTDCGLMEIGPAFDHKGFGIGVPQGANYRELLTMAILEMGDTGRLHELEEKWWGQSKCPDITNPSADDTTELGLENVAGIFFVLLGGIILASLFCVVENVLRQKGHRLKPRCLKATEENKGIDNDELEESKELAYKTKNGLTV